jgi:hypothetical protein
MPSELTAGERFPGMRSRWLRLNPGDRNGDTAIAPVRCAWRRAGRSGLPAPKRTGEGARVAPFVRKQKLRGLARMDARVLLVRESGSQRCGWADARTGSHWPSRTRGPADWSSGRDVCLVGRVVRPARRSAPSSVGRRDRSVAMRSSRPRARRSLARLPVTSRRAARDPGSEEGPRLRAVAARS